jgi:hypothetical protein
MSKASVCFVAMPAGRAEPEGLLYLAWFRLVIEPAIKAAGLLPHLQLLQNAPVQIAAEIRRQLVEAPMAVFDLGGASVDASSNPNVMYELGIRHAYGRPAVLHSWAVPPFDVGEQHAVLAPREAAHIESAVERLTDAISRAANGEFLTQWKLLV